MAASHSTEGQRSEERPEFPHDTAPEVVPTPSEKEAEELRKKKRAQLQKASANPEGNTDEGAGSSEPAGPVDPEPSSTGANEPAHFVAELAVVSMHEDLDHEISDAPPFVAELAVVSMHEDLDIVMTDAPPLSSYDTSVPEVPDSDVEMVDAPPLQPDEE